MKSRHSWFCAILIIATPIASSMADAPRSKWLWNFSQFVKQRESDEAAGRVRLTSEDSPVTAAPIDEEVAAVIEATSYKLQGPETMDVVPSGPTSTIAQPSASEKFATSVFGPRNSSENLLSRVRRSRSRRVSADVVIGAEGRFRTATDAGSLINKARNSGGLSRGQRSPIITDTRLRGSKFGELLASGSYWFPARPDIDTLMSKIDSRIVEDAIVIKGPYSALYGPAFNFVDIELVGAPRYENGSESHGMSSFEYKENGDQIYGRQSFWGGDEKWGYRVGYGHRTGNDYETGNGDELIASYKSRDIDLALGYTINENMDIEFTYLRQDQTDVELAGSLNDLDYVKTDGYEVELNMFDMLGADSIVAEGWYNQTFLV